MFYEHQNDKSNSTVSVTPLSSRRVAQKKNQIGKFMKSINSKTAVERNYGAIIQLNSTILSQVTRSEIFLIFAL